MCALALLCAACGRPPEPAATSSTEPRVVSVNPARIDRARSALPDGYEVAGYAEPSAPITLWGFGDAAASEPVQCGALVAPALDPATTRGWSASGPGGIVYAVVARSTHSAGTRPRPALRVRAVDGGRRTHHGVGHRAVRASRRRGADRVDEHRDDHRRRRRNANTFARRDIHRLPGRLRLLGGARHRPRFALSHTRRRFRRRSSDHRRVGATRLSRLPRVHWRRCPTRR